MRKTEWKPCRLDELGFVGRGKSRHRPRNDARLYDGPYPFIQTVDIMGADPYITSYTQTYSEFGLQQSKLWPPNTLCMTIAGANTAETAILKFEACFPDNIVGFIPDQTKADIHFVKYSLDLMKDRFRAVTRGATQDNLSLDKLLSFPISTPPLPVQRQIAGILSAYDGLIENNTRRIKILEEMARAIYREWFVHFRFPGHEKVKMVDSPSGKTPAGWSVLTLGDVLQEIESGSRPKGGIDAEERGIPSIGAENVLGLGQYDYSKEKFVSQSFYESMRRGHVQNRDVLLYKDGVQIGRKTIFGDGFPHETCCINEHVFDLRANDRCTQAYLFFWLDQPDMTQAICNLNANAAQPGLNQMSVKGLPIILPPKSLLDEFDKPANQALGLIFNLAKKTNVLRGTRDLLLPKLISGEIPVPDLESFPEKALT